jgi:NAD(P)-dependent dehydrogenase (short-subunit alcohol dehydrogenase family)
MQFQAKTVLITGCSTGIGYTTAHLLKQRGHQVIATARKQQDVVRLKQEGFEALRLDLANSTSIKQAVTHVVKRYEGKIDALFNNAAFGQPGAVEDLSRDVLRQQFETNLFGTHELTNLILPYMRQQGQGRIIYNSSVLGFIALTYRGAYTASKFALEGLADTLRLELQSTQIKVILIEPGPIESNFRNNSLTLYQQNIDAENSVHKQTYKAMEERLQKQGPAVAFTLPAAAVTKKVIHALESPRPKIRYAVTFPTYLFAYLKRLLPASMLDKMLIRI